MGNSKRYLCALFLIFLVHFGIFSQNIPVVAAYNLSSNDVGENVSKTVNDLIFSFIRELRNYRITDMRSDALPRDLQVPDGTDYIFYGSLIKQQDGIKLELVLKGGPFNVTRLISRVYENSNRILLESRLLVRDLFDQSVALPDPIETVSDGPNGTSSRNGTAADASAKKALISVSNIDSLAGSWRGEEGIEKVMILRGGRGVAILSSGISLSLDLVLAGTELVIRQKGASNPRQFVDLSDTVAKQAATIVPPLEWRFLITVDQKTLMGTKKTVVIKNDGKNILSMENTVFDVSWVRE